MDNNLTCPFFDHFYQVKPGKAEPICLGSEDKNLYVRREQMHVGRVA